MLDRGGDGLCSDPRLVYKGASRTDDAATIPANHRTDRIQYLGPRFPVTFRVLVHHLVACDRDGAAPGRERGRRLADSWGGEGTAARAAEAALPDHLGRLLDPGRLGPP